MTIDLERLGLTAMHDFPTKYGIVILVDALGAREYSDDKIREFLLARSRLNKILANQANSLQELFRSVPQPKPATFTFGDTLIVVAELEEEKYRAAQVAAMLILMQNYLFNSMEAGIVFRGAFSIGTYIDDPASNTVMGEALTDAASWYEKSDWFGLASTPRTNNVLELIFFDRKDMFDPKFLLQYPVPMKDGRAVDLYTVSWAGRFFQIAEKNPEKTFLEAVQKLPMPLGTESKHINSKKYFYDVARLLKTDS